MKRIDDELAREIKRFGPAGAMPRIVEVWVAAVGATIAQNAWPARIARDGTLHVATSSSSWAFELAQLQAEILRRLRAAAGAAAPSTVRFAVGKLPDLTPETRAADARAVPKPTTDDERRAAELTAPIEDPELRRVVARAAAQSLAGSRRRP